jgi:hypothetical protein
MTLKMIKDGSELSLEDRQFSELNKFCSEKNIQLRFEWIHGQFWLHSDNPHENPIGIEIDKILLKHEEFFKKSSIHKELLARAVGVKGANRPKVLDLTAGLLGDSLLMLSFGCEVWAVERHPVVRFLIQTALHNSTHKSLLNLHFIESDALTVLSENPAVDTVYFDPMFEDANDKASPKKEMRIFRSLVGSDEDAIKVLKIAENIRPKRLVVKRPRLSQELGKKPSVQYIGKSTRYDVYFSL